MFSVLFALIAVSVAGCMNGNPIDNPDVRFVFLENDQCDSDRIVCDVIADDPRRK